MQKVSSEFAVTLIVILVIFLGGLIWLEGHRSWDGRSPEGFSDELAMPNEMPVREKNKEREMPAKNNKNVPVEIKSSAFDWKTYEHEKLRLRVSCPAEYMPNVDVDKAGEQVFSVRKMGDTEKECTAEGCALSVKVSEPTVLGKKAKTPEEFTTALKELGTEFTETTIDGNIAYKYDTNMYVSFLRDGDAYSRYDFTVQDAKLGSQILSTFRFPQVTAEISLQ